MRLSDIRWNQENKYGNHKTIIDGITFDSRREADYYAQLQMLIKGHVVKSFERQVPFELQPGYKYRGQKVRPIVYVADFVVHFADDHTEIVDVKGFITKEYKLKKKMLLYQHPEYIFVEA